MKVFIAIVCCLVCAVHGKTPVVPSFDSGFRIVGGKDAAPKQFPHQAYLGNCGGVLIHPQWILTAAACMKNINSFTIKLGSIHTTAQDENSVTVTSNEFIQHENWDQKLFENDIGLIKLPQPVKLTEYIQPIRLSASDDYIEVGVNLTVSGFGLTGPTREPALKYVVLQSISNELCAQYYKPEYIFESTICCMNEAKESFCYGDMGGPLMKYENDGKATLVGIASFVSGYGCDSGYPNGFGRISEHRAWIAEKTGGDVP